MILPEQKTHSVGLKALLTLPVLVFEGASEVRLVDGGSRCAGRVEVKLHDEWGTVCGHSWDKDAAAVVCRQLGCGVALEAPQDSYFGPGSGPISMIDVLCSGNEYALSDCTHERWSESICSHDVDAGVICSGKGSVPSPPFGSCAGGGTWLCPQHATSECQTMAIRIAELALSLLVFPLPGESPVRAQPR